MRDIRTRFHEALKKGLLSHAYILEGGDGKTRRELALDLAMLLLCQKNATISSPRPCMECRSCKKAMANEHPDLLLIQPEKGMIRLDGIRRLISALKYPPFEAQVRAVVILEGDKMNPEAANTLLKTLEEPPPGNCIIIATPSSQSLLPTICSRCQTLNATPKDVPQVTGAPGAKGQFLQALREIDTSGMEELGEERALELREAIFDIMKGYFIAGEKAPSIAKAFSIAKEVAREPFLFFVITHCLKSIARDVLFLRELKGDPFFEGVLINEDQADLLKILATFFNDVELFEHTFRVQELENMVRRGINLEYAINSIMLFWFGEHG